MTTSAVNMFRLRPGVTPEDFERFSAELDRPRCLAFDVVLEFEVFLTEEDGADVDVVEVMTVASWPEWEEVRDSAPELADVVARFDELVEPGSVTTVLCKKSAFTPVSPLPQEI